jgi:electron transport complex protein RnfE
MSALDGFAMGAGLTLALTLMGAVREVLGSGTLFSGASTLLGPALGVLELRVYPGDGALVMILPAGGFVVLGLLIAGKRALDARKPAPRLQSTPVATIAPAGAAA